MNVLEENVKFRFTEPKLSKIVSGNKWVVFVYYYIDNVRNEIRYSQGLNKKYFTENNGLGLKEIKRRNSERETLSNSIIEYVKNWIETRIFDSQQKAFLVPNRERVLIESLNGFIKFKEREKLKKSSINQYQSKLNSFKNYLTKSKALDLRLCNVNKQLYVDYFHGLRDEKRKANWYNDILTFHRMFYNWLIDIEEVEIKNPVKVIKPLGKEDIIKHKAIPSDLIKESFRQVDMYGSNILALFVQFIFYSLHRPNTLTQLQFKDFDLKKKVINIPSDKIKTKKSIVLKMHPKLTELVENFKTENDILSDDYLFGYEIISSVRGSKKQYRLFGKYQSETIDFIQKFKHFNEKQIDKAYKRDDSLYKIFKYGENTLYGYKHTGVVYLRELGWSLEQIIQLTGHKDTEIAKWYGRDFRPKIPEFTDLS
ncbi:tyrosine-type recombinase/integrase [Sphingobacterium siyangense]|uniref:tyrosine-type recombinase/integrase n=1 Tax=Sphingobacterium siyangense TaxID=459529 RepID=UPI003DA5D9B5